MPSFTQDQLTTFSANVLRKLGASDEDARLAAEILIRSDVRGYPTHGIGILPEYVQRARAGTIHVDARPALLHEGKATAQIDGNLYLGQVVGTQAMSLAIDKARAHGLGAVGARNCAHFGRAADYVEQAAQAGMVGMAYISTGGASLATFGSRESTGNSNPIAFGIPGPNGEHLIFDFTTAAMSMREIARRGAVGEPIPAGIVLDKEGTPTTDYAQYAGPPRGVALPFGGYKGSGLNLVAEVLGGLLTGHGTGMSWAPKGGPAINGGLFVALDVTEFMPLDAFLKEVDELGSFLRSRQPQAGVDAVRLPGDGARARAAERIASGIPIDEKLLVSLNTAATELDLPPLG